MAPLQHHFELVGWNEVTIVIRFWIIAGLCVGLGLGLFYAEWVAEGARECTGGSGPTSGPARDAARRPPRGADLRRGLGGLTWSSAGSGVSGFAAADALLERGAHVTVVDAGDGRRDRRARARSSTSSARDAHGGRGAVACDERRRDLLDGVDLVVTSPGVAARPAAARRRRRPPAIPVWGEVELAWRMRPGTRARRRG